MSNKNPSLKKVAAFFEGRGFYVVLGLCVMAIVVSGIMMSADRQAEEQRLRLEQQQIEDLLNNPPEAEVGSGIELTIPGGSESLIEFIPGTGENPGRDTTPVTELEHEPAEPVSKPEKVTISQPVFVNPVEGEIVNAFSDGELVYDITFGDWRTHRGIDFSCQPGERVCAIADGKVESIKTDQLYGTTVTISHDDGIVSTYYNLMPNVLVSVGDNVAINEVIGGLGDDALFESNDEYHLHVEITKDGVLIDPASILP